MKGSKLRVVLLGPYPVDENLIPGGVVKVTYNLVEGFKGRDDIDLHVVSLSDVRESYIRRDGNITFHFLKAQQKYCLPTFSCLSFMRARSAIRRIDPDLVHCQETFLEAPIAASLPYPSLVGVHGIFTTEGKFHPGLKARLRFAQVRLMTGLAAHGIDLYIPSSRYVAREMRVRARKLTDVIENPIERRYFEIDERSVPGRLLFAGAMYQRKGVTDLIRAARILKDGGVPFSLHLAGAIRSEEYNDEVNGLVRSLGLESEVKLLGFIAEDVLTAELGKASIVVLPSYAETSPMIIQQAMAAGKPVVATDVGGIPHLIAEGASGRMVKPGDVEALARVLGETLSDDGKCLEMGEAARREAESRFKSEAVVATTIDVYRRLLKRD